MVNLEILFLNILLTVGRSNHSGSSSTFPGGFEKQLKNVFDPQPILEIHILPQLNDIEINT